MTMALRNKDAPTPTATGNEGVETAERDNVTGMPNDGACDDSKCDTDIDDVAAEPAITSDVPKKKKKKKSE